jgi:hypothetical protein
MGPTGRRISTAHGNGRAASCACALSGVVTGLTISTFTGLGSLLNFALRAIAKQRPTPMTATSRCRDSQKT